MGLASAVAGAAVGAALPPPYSLALAAGLGLKAALQDRARRRRKLRRRKGKKRCAPRPARAGTPPARSSSSSAGSRRGGGGAQRATCSAPSILLQLLLP